MGRRTHGPLRLTPFNLSDKIDGIDGLSCVDPVLEFSYG
jgi:hypothetical protein